jgi:hypothetical protein
VVGGGAGGGLANLIGAVSTVGSCTFTDNSATGGVGAAGASGGNGLGGGAYNDGQSTLTILGSTITGNQSTGGAAGSGGTAGLGEGGGLYLAAGGVACLDMSTSTNISGNTASTSDTDIFGFFTIC